VSNSASTSPSPATPSKPARRKGVFIGRYFGIEIYLDYSWFIIAAVVIYELSVVFFPANLEVKPTGLYYVMGTTAALLFFLSILLHELGHSLVSQRCGIPVPRITLLFIGGLAEIAREPDDPKSELKIALGGPIVSVVLILIYSALWWLFESIHWLPAAMVCGWLAMTNLSLVVFNMVPGYPLDGGRVLRALLWAKTGKLRRATFIASRIGIGFSWVLILTGLYLVMVYHQANGVVFFLIALFLKGAADSGYNHALQREILTGVTVRNIMTAEAAWIPASLPLNLAVDDYFLTNHHVAFPVCTEDREFRGLLRLEFLKEIPKEKWPYTSAGDAVAEWGGKDLQIDVETSAARAMRRLLATGTGRLAVTEHGKLVGIVTRHDILHFIEIHTELEG